METLEEAVIEIDNYIDYVAALELISQELNVPLNDAPLQSFKDALWHYTELYEVSKKKAKSPRYMNHVFSIEQHLFCGLQSVIVTIIDTIKMRIAKFLDEDHGSYKRKQEMRSLFHEYKFLKIDVLSGELNYSIREMEESILRLKDLYEKTLEICKKLGSERCILKGL